MPNLAGGENRKISGRLQGQPRPSFLPPELKACFKSARRRAGQVGAQWQIVNRISFIAYGVWLTALLCRSQHGDRRDADMRYVVGPQEGFPCAVL
jgi:hypothetical protein